MPDKLRDRIAAILHAHTLAENDPVFWRCCCTAYSDSFKDDYIAHDAHVADAVIAALGLREERSLDGQTVNRDGFSHGGMKHRWVEPTAFHRYVTEWTTDE